MAKYRMFGKYHPRGSLIQGYRSIDHPLYLIWGKMIDRCENKDSPAFKNYGGRGITVCRRWRASFENFAADMGERPSPSHSIDRIDNTKGYSPDNCRWATPLEQAQNKRVYATSTTEAGGVTETKAGNFKACWNYDGIRYNLGRFATVAEATAARAKFIELFHTDREAAMAMTERRARYDSATGVRGITPHADGGFLVRKTVKGLRKYLGYRKTFEEALALWTEHK